MSIAQIFASAAAAAPEAEFLHVPAAAAAGYARGPISLGYGAAAATVEEIASIYHAAGFGRGHRVALALDNRVEFFLHFLALNRLGVAIVPLAGTLGREEMRRLLEHSDAALLVCLPQYEAHARSALAPNCAIAVAPIPASGLAPPRRAAATVSDEVALLYTSGTTGAPKGCLLDEAYFESIGRHYVGIGGYCGFLPGRDRLITPLPVTHMNALACSLMAMLMTRGCLIQLDRFHPSSWWASVRESRASCFHYLGVMPAMLLAAPPDGEEDFGSQLRFGFGAGVDPRHHEAFERRFGVRLIEAWAMTETGAGAWITASHEPRHPGERCFGRPPPGLEWRLTDERGAECAAGEPGELLVKRAGAEPRRGFFRGYYRDDAATEAAWEGGWFHTGDVVRVGADGSMYFVDRRKNVIRRSGENIAAVEVESALLQDPAVAACAVCAVEDEIRGEEVFAFVVPRGPLEGVDGPEGARLAASIQAHCLERLVYFKTPGWIAFRGELPQTASQKIARGVLKRMAAQALAEGGAHDLRGGKRRSTRGGGHT
ncbi:MAG: AMP-binding protein [Gammaproteobacteria bacterium]|nr:AMP-binding protein [Gammaproteobacteria bacterium]